MIKQQFDIFILSINASLPKWSPSKTVFSIQINIFANFWISKEFSQKLKYKNSNESQKVLGRNRWKLEFEHKKIVWGFN